MSKVENVTSGHKWFVFITAFVVLAVDVGLFLSLGVLFVDIMNTFKVSRTETVVVQSAGIGVYQCSGVINGAIVSRFGARKAGMFGACLAAFGLSVSFVAPSVTFLYFSISFCMALGVSIVYISSSTIVGKLFVGKMNTVLLSIHGTGSGIGGMGYPYLLTFLDDTFGLRGTYLLSGAIMLNTLAVAQIWKSPKERVNNQMKDAAMKGFSIISKEGDFTDNEYSHDIHNKDPVIVKGNPFSNEYSNDKHNKDATIEDSKSLSSGSCYSEQRGNTNKSHLNEGNIHMDHCYKLKHLLLWLVNKLETLLRFPGFKSFIVAQSIAFAALELYLFFVVDVFADKGFDESDASVGLMIFNISGIVGRLLPGTLMMLPFVSTLAVPMFAYALGTCGLVSLILVTNYELIMVISAVLGLSFGILVTAYTVTIVRLVGSTNLAMALGVSFTCTGIVTTATGPISGYIRDETGTYTISLSIAAGTACLAFIIMLFTESSRLFHKRNL